MKSIYTSSIPNETKFVAIFQDGSGAELFEINSNGELENYKYEYPISAPDAWLIDAGFGYWIELPRSFKLWKPHQREEAQKLWPNTQ